MLRVGRVAVAILAVMVIGAGCAHSQGPVLYPNAKLKEAGKAQADAEISACRSLADDYVSSGGARAKEIGKDTAVGGVAGRPSAPWRGPCRAARRGAARLSARPPVPPRALSTVRSRARGQARSTRASWIGAYASGGTRSSAGSSGAAGYGA